MQKLNIHSAKLSWKRDANNQWNMLILNKVHFDFHFKHWCFRKSSLFFGSCWQKMCQKWWNMAVCSVTWWLQDHHRWSLRVVSQEGSSSAVHQNLGGSRASPVHILPWSLATWSEQPYSLRQKQTYMSRNRNTSTKTYFQMTFNKWTIMKRTSNSHTKVDAHPVLCVLSFNLDIWLLLFLKIFVLKEEKKSMSQLQKQLVSIGSEQFKYAISYHFGGIKRHRTEMPCWDAADND